MKTLLNVIGWALVVLGGLVAIPLWILDWLPTTQYLSVYAVYLATFIPLLWAPTLAFFFGLVIVLRHFWRFIALGIAVVLTTMWGVQTVGSFDRDTTPAGDIQFVSLNAQYGRADLEQLEREIQPSTTLLVIQEFTPDMQGRMTRAGFDDEFPHFVGKARTDAGGTAIYSRKPLTEIDQYEGIFLNLVVEVSDDKGNPVKVAAIHTAPPPMGVDAWRDDARAIADMLEPHADGALLAVGDFNAINDHATMAAFHETGLIDPMSQLGVPFIGKSSLTRWQPTWPVGKRVPPFARIDHMLVTKQMGWAEPRYFEVDGSDHAGIAGGVWAHAR